MTEEADGTAPRCLFCGGPEVIEVAEVWADHRWWPETCCEGLYGHLVASIAEEPEWARGLLDRLLARAGLGGPLRRIADDGACGLVLDWHPRVAPVAFRAAAEFVRRHHAHCRPPVAARFCHAATNGFTTMGVAVTGNPVARALMGRGIVEVNRLCVRRDLPRALAWNAASMLLGAAAREAARRGFERIVTYTLSEENGVSLHAAGFVAEARVRGRGWHRRGRARSDTNAWTDKTRWARALRPRPAGAPAAAPAEGKRPEVGYGGSGMWGV